eukprot:scaffold1318_cov116-Skeletonema_marinoi.AAC.1
MKILDGFGSSVEASEKESDEFTKLLARIWNSNVWKDSLNPASSIRGDLDATLISMMMHITQCKWRFDGGELPMEKLLLPHVSLIRKGSFFKPKPSFALIFVVHTMLMSIFELQGDGDIFRIRDVAKNSFDRFVSQAGEHLESEIPCHTKRKSLLKFITDTKRVTETSDDADFEKAYPMMSKELHDLLIHELVDDGLPLLADIDRYFEKTKCIWNGWDKPQQG